MPARTEPAPEEPPTPAERAGAAPGTSAAAVGPAAPAWAVRALVVAGALVAVAAVGWLVIWLVLRIPLVTLAIALALLLAALTSPIAVRLRRAGLPPAVGALVSVLLLLVLRVVVMHAPATFAALPAGRAANVAGHTHCGQVAVPGRPHWAHLGPGADAEVAAGGWAPDGYGAAGNRLYVTCGIGLDRAPVRLFVPPQVLFIDLSPASAP